MTQIKIDDRLVGEGCQPFIIAEAGINHNGELQKAFEMIKVARESGADAIKFQTFKAEEFVGDPNLTYSYKTQGIEITESMLKMFQRHEFTKDQWHSIKKKCDEEKIMFLSTPQNRSDLDLLLDVGIPAIKVGSDDFTNIPLLKSYAETNLPMIVSSGMSDLSEVYQSLEAIGTFENYPTILLVCTSQYPTPPEDVNLNRLRTLSAAFPMVVLGFSDHTQGPLASSLAVALKASVFEKHFTLDHNFAGPDHWFSEDPQGLTEWISSIKQSFLMVGNGMVRPSATEIKNKREFQRVIIAAADIYKGEVFSLANLAMKRMPGEKGLPPKLVYYLYGNKANKHYKKGECIDFI